MGARFARGPRADRVVIRPHNCGDGSTVAALTRGDGMLWLIIGIVLLIIAIGGGVIVNPILFVLAILALAAFFFGGSRGRAV
jgi:hypothetical protein